jgi:hypothetical protein
MGDNDGGKVFVHWSDLKPTYRGREKKDVKPLDLKHVRRISLMMRRYVGCFHLCTFSLMRTASSARRKETSPCLLPRYPRSKRGKLESTSRLETRPVWNQFPQETGGRKLTGF